ncbi:MAG TPA: histidinol-phosphate transaminase, partial [Alphaproteobacteria bacterium]|nr:histidinol-phosphate transaminase [Alphaproteobacteria bacterium]
DRIIALCEAFAGRALVVVDETYIDYAAAPSLIDAMETHANLVILRTLSKSHAAAGVRLGAALARQDVTALMGKVLAPYPIPQPVIQAAMAIMSPDNLKRLAAKREDILGRRDVFANALQTLDDVISVFPSDANY